MGFIGILLAAVIGWHLFEYLASLIRLKDKSEHTVCVDYALV